LSLRRLRCRSSPSPSKEFCKAHRISVSYYYELKKLGRAPREMMLGTRRIISAEAAAAWRAENTVEPTS
jgi:hypothetical protein